MQVNNSGIHLKASLGIFLLNIACKTSEMCLQSCFIFIGIGICVQPLYLGEIAPTALRGAMGMGTSIFITGGILTGQVIGLK